MYMRNHWRHISSTNKMPHSSTNEDDRDCVSRPRT